MDSNSVDRLLRSDAFSHPLQDLRLLETHISWVILTGEFAYKIKKPVDFGFLNFRTLPQRRYFCEQELVLNRRFSPELYLDVVPITGTAQRPRVGGNDTVLDYAVRMRQFDQAAVLSNRVAEGGFDRVLTRRLARCLASVHDSLPALFPDSGAGTPDALFSAMDDSLRQILDFDIGAASATLVREIRSWSAAQRQILQSQMRERVRDGAVRECHGDLHLGNVVLIEDQPRLFDCIEFNREFRIMDTASELAFLTMDMQARGLHMQGCANLLLSDYLEYRADYAALTLLPLYRCHYALVRAKVKLLQSEGVDGSKHQACVDEALAYLRHAHSCRERPAPFLALMHGVSGSGKSTVSERLCARTGAVRLRSDVLRKALFQLAPEQHSGVAQRAEIYGPDASARTFAGLLDAARDVLAAGESCIVDATFLQQRSRDPFRKLAAQSGTPFHILHCEASTGQLRERLARRKFDQDEVSEADSAVMQRQLETVDPFSNVEKNCVAGLECVEKTPDQLASYFEGVIRSPR